MYNKNNYKRIKREFEQKHLAAGDAALQRQREVQARIPELRQIDAAMAETGAKIFRAALQGRDGLEERISRLQKENEELQSVRASVLEANGYAPDYTKVKYECPLCNDTGFTTASRGEALCICMKRALVLAGYESSGIGGLFRTQTFETFSLDYYPQANRPDMAKILAEAQKYVSVFSAETASNIIMFGGTGLGKTHLSTAVAKAVIDRGFDVVYETAQNVFSDFETEKFGRGGSSSADEGKLTDRYFDCDLLILDDLGAEMSTSFTIAALYNLLNTRLNRNKSVIISTNLAYPDIIKRYTERVSSRLLGEYHQFAFAGRDIRMEKIRAGMQK